jgi:hypothetical protein
MRVKMTVAVAALAALLLGLPASSYANRTVHVEVGESIQAAIDAAKPGTTIKIEEGTYEESLEIAKDGIELIGEGRKKTRIVPPADPALGECGICVSDFGHPENIVEDVEISHLAVDGFGIGIFYLGTEDGAVTRTILSDYGEYGLFANNSSGTTVARNVTYNSVADVNPEAGIYVGDSPHADATVWKNVAWGNLLGIFVRDAEHGQVLKNKSFSNCVGILFLNTDAPDGLAHWLAKHNNVTANNRVCPEVPGGEAPPLSGVGIAILGGTDIDLIDNGVFGNKSAGPSAFAGGIVVTTSPFGAAPVPSTDIKVAFNTALGNDPDLFWDEAGEGNAFFANDCLTSVRDGLCEDSAGDGDHGDDDQHGGDRDHGDRKHKKGQKHKKGKKKHKKSKKHDRDD